MGSCMGKKCDNAARMCRALMRSSRGQAISCLSAFQVHVKYLGHAFGKVGIDPRFWQIQNSFLDERPVLARAMCS